MGARPVDPGILEPGLALAPHRRIQPLALPAPTSRGAQFWQGERLHLLANNFTPRKPLKPTVLVQQEIPACMAADLRAACFRSIFLPRSRDGSEKKTGGESCASWIAFLSACCHHNKMIGRAPQTFAIICPASFSLGNIYDCECASCRFVALRPVLVSGCQ